jgi:hypothetical protein
MRVTRLQLRNFRCFESLDLDLDQTTVLVGANDTGKSVALEALRILFDPDVSCDWGSAVRSTRDNLGERPDALILAELADLTPDEAKEWKPIAPDGIFRLAKSSLTGDALRWATDPAGLADLAAQFDRDFESVAFDGDLTLVDLGTFDYPIEPFERLLFALPTVVAVIPLGGPTDASWSPLSVVRPIITSRLHELLADDEVDKAVGKIHDGIVKLGFALSAAHSTRLAPKSSFSAVQWQSSLEQVRLIDAVVEVILDSFQLRVWHRSGGSGLPIRAEGLGPGSRRALALAGLDLYRDPDFNPRPGPNQNWASDLVLLLVEEPETGLHAAAQRRLAESLHDLATFGVQLVMVTHSPAFLNATDARGVRLARRIETPDGGTRATVVRPEGLSEIRSSLGIKPADILLARRFVVVEGDSDRLVFTIWARRLGIELRERGVQLVPSWGNEQAERVATIIELAYEGAEFVVVLDNGDRSQKARREIQKRHGDRVEVIVLSQPAIEDYYHPHAIAAWLWEEGSVEPGLERIVEEKMLGSQDRYRSLEALCDRYLGRGLRKVSDGRTIADLTCEQEIHPEIQTMLLHVSRDE